MPDQLESGQAEALEGVDGAWQRLQTSVEAHNAVGTDGDADWVKTGLRVVRRRAAAFLKAIDGLLESIEG
jgi:hypothetical protein